MNPRHQYMTLLDRLESHAALRGESIAVEVSRPGTIPTRSLTYAELATRVHSFAAMITGILEPGEVVAVAAPSHEAYIVAYLGTLEAGCIIHPIPNGSSTAEVLNFLEVTGARILVGDDAVLAAASEARGIRLVPLDDLPNGVERTRRISIDGLSPALYLPSSGTTGLPKIAVRSRDSLDAVAANVAAAAGLKHTDRVLAAVPLSHSYGMENGLLGPIWAGACIRLIDRGNTFDHGEMLDELRSGGISVFPAVPFMLDMLSKLVPERESASSMRLVYTAGAPLPRAVAELFASRFALVPGQLYGATELGSVTFAPPGSTNDPQCVGGPVPGVSILVLDAGSPDVRRPLPTATEGHIAIRADSMLSHYLGGDRTDPAFLDGYFLTGDLGTLDARGALTVTGRIKLLIDVGGFKVNPLEVERALALHPGVAEVVVVPIPVSETVSRLRALVVPAAGEVSIDELRALAKDRLAPHKVPRVFEVVSRLPKSATGKILRRQLEAHT